MHVLMLLRDMGLDPESDEARRAMGLVRDRVTWKGVARKSATPIRSSPVRSSRVSMGQVAAGGAYFGQDVRGIVDRLLTEQLADGGWNCEAANGSTRSSFNTTICVLEALLAYEQRFGNTNEIAAARLAGRSISFERRLFRGDPQAS
jgi:hypothetical protein